jgi:dCTP deaminase
MYSDTDILAAMRRKDIEISPYDPDQLQTNSYDLRLGNTFYELFWDAQGPFYVGPYVYLDGEKVDIPIGGTLLGMTKERIGTNGKVVAELRSRSTTRRKGGTTNIDAGLGDIGYNNYWTVELTAFTFMRQMDFLKRGEPVLSNPTLTVGSVVAQMVFYECKSEPTRKYNGQYQVEWPLNMIPKDCRHRIIKP